MQHESPKGHQVGQRCSGRRRAAPMGAGTGVGSAWVTPGEQMLPEHPLQLPWGRFCHVLLVFRARGAAGVVPPPRGGQSPLLLPSLPPLRLNEREKEERNTKKDPRTAPKMMCVFCSQPRRCFCLVNQKNICVLLFQPAHQQTAAWPSLSVRAAVVFFCAEVVQMNPAVKWCPSSPPPREDGRCSAISRRCT